MRALLCLLALFALSGCAQPAQEISFQLVQCEAPPWGDDQSRPPWDSEENRAAISKHYGVEVTSIRVLQDGNAYMAVCGALSGNHVVITIDGDPAALVGWQMGTP